MTGNQDGVVRVRSQADARALAARLNADTRTTPVVVVSTAAGEREPYVDVDEVRQALGELAEVYLIPTGEVSWAFAGAMPAMTQVYGGASRVYPVDLEWTTRPSKSPLRFAYGAKDRARVTDQVISDAMGMALAAGLLNVPSARAAVRLEGSVMGVAGGRAIVTMDNGEPGTIWPELTVADVDGDRLFAKGMRIAGAFDTVQRRLDVRESLLPLEVLLAAYQEGATALGKVTRLDAGGCHVELVPGVRVFVDAKDASADTGVGLTSLMSVGEIVTARVVRVGEPNGKGWRLTLVDVDPDAKPYAACLLAGGPPWLVRPEPLPAEVEEEEGAVAAAPLGEFGEVVDGPVVAALQAERDGFLAELEAVRGRLARLEKSRERLRTQAREAVNDADRRRREVQRLEGELSRVARDSELFLDPVKQLDFEIRLAWARRIPPGEKEERPLGGYVVGPQFLESWRCNDGVDRQKVLDVIVDIVTGRVHEIPGRETHQLRTSEGGNAPFVTRADGATCWRVSLQVNTPQARRLHYWQLANRTVELSSVRNHDDIRP